MSLCVLQREAIEHAITSTLPQGPGQRDGRLWELARALKGIPELVDANAADLTPILRDWYERAKPRTSGEHDFDDTRLGFARAWSRAILPGGDDPLRLVLARADAAGTPPEADHYDHTGRRRLAGLCRELQAAAGDQPFYLSARTVARLFELKSWSTGSQWLRLLEMDKLLWVAERGSEARMKATRYRYIGQPP